MIFSGVKTPGIFLWNPAKNALTRIGNIAIILYEKYEK